MADQWGAGQLALFEALAEVVDRAGGGSGSGNGIAPMPSRRFINKLRQLEIDSKAARELKQILHKSIAESLSGNDYDDLETYKRRIRQLMIKEQILDTAGMDTGFADRFLREISREYGGTDLEGLATRLRDLRRMVRVMEGVVTVPGERMTVEEVDVRLRGMKERSLMLDRVLECPEHLVTQYVAGIKDQLGVVATAVNPAEGPSKEARAAMVAEFGDPDETDEDPEVAAAEVAVRPSFIAPMTPSSPRPPQDKPDSDAIEEIRKKSNAKLKKVIDANKTLQAKLRQVADNRNRWSKYAEHLEQKLEKSSALLKEHNLAVPKVNKDVAQTTEAEQTEGGLSRPQTLERDGIIDVVTPEREHARPPTAPTPPAQSIQTAADGRRYARAATDAPRTANAISETLAAEEEKAQERPETYAEFIAKLARFHVERRNPFWPHPMIQNRFVDLQKLFLAAISKGGFLKVDEEDSGWNNLAEKLGLSDRDDSVANAADALRSLYVQYLALYEAKHFQRKEPLPQYSPEAGTVGGQSSLSTMKNLHSGGRWNRNELESNVASAARPSASVSEPPQSSSLFVNQTAVQPEPVEEPSEPRLPKLLHTTTVPDSLASSSSLSQQHTSSTQAEHPTSGADTINAAEANEANAPAAPRLPPSDDEPPVVVSERQVRKRKQGGSSPTKKKIKQERVESSPIALLGFRHLQTQESMDLDDIGPKTATPKKRKEKQSAASLSGLGDEYVPAQDRVYEHAPTFAAAERDEQDASDTPVARPSPGTPAAPFSASSILKPRSTNATILPRTSAKQHSAKWRRISDKGADLFSEDGENHLAPTDTEVVESPSRALPRATATRLSNLLEKPSPRRWQVMNMDDESDSEALILPTKPAPPAKKSKSTIKPRQTIHERLAAQRAAARAPIDLSGRRTKGQIQMKGHESDDGMPDLAKLIKMKGRKRIGDKVPSPETPAPVAQRGRQRVMEDVPSTARPEEEPLATRPVSRLSLDDFRINPEYNNGLDYAYRDVVRGREKRKCLAGCTDPACCGEGFRALAEIATPVRENLTTAEKEEEDKLIAEFLGRDAARLIKHMGKDERRETLIKAKTRELANKHGKHRHAYERRKSPPGFWRADFPTTQEEAEDREKAKVFERDLVQKRYEEAMRGGGKWIFKDQMGGQPDWIGKE